MQILHLLRKSEKPNYTPVDLELVPKPEAPSSESKTWSRFRHGWRFTVATGAVVSFLVLWTNVGILFWAKGKDGSSDNIITVFQGSCAQRDRTITLCHLAINVLSTLLLGASSSCMQVLGAPTREEIDFYHTHGAWLDLGILSWRNLKRISRWRVGLLLLVGLTSIPLHLVWVTFNATLCSIAAYIFLPSYNSIIFGTQNNSQFVAVLVAQDFVTGGTFQPTAAIMPLCNQTSPWPAPVDDRGNSTTDACIRKNYEGQAPDASQIQQLQLNLASLERLENADCVKTFRNAYESEYRGVVLVSNVTNGTDSVLQFLDTHLDFKLDSGYQAQQDNGWWMCANNWAHSLLAPEFVYAEEDGHHSPIYNTPSQTCTPTSLASNPAGWQMFDPSAADSSSVLDIEYCLAERSKFPECTIGFSKSLMLVVIIFNGVKVLCFILTLKLCTSPLITIGDALASFLEHPDSTTIGFGTHPVKDIHQYRAWKALRHPEPGTSTITPPLPKPHRWEAPKRRLWHESISVLRKLWTLGLRLVFWFVSLFLLAIDHDDRYNAGAGYQKIGFGSISSSYLLSASVGRSLTTDILLANAPQLAMSFIYGFYNSCLTLMVQSDEYLRFGTQRRTLRVSVPVGGQRSTFWFNLPYRYAVPMMIAMALLHWLISQSIFLARTYVWDYSYTIDDQYSVSGTGWSNFALLFTLILGLLTILTLLMMGRFRRYPTNMPLARSNSAAISAACHRREGEDGDMVERPLKYGVLSPADAQGRKRVGFSAEEVEPLVSGEVYI